MEIIEVIVQNKIASAQGATIVCGNEDYVIKFIFDEEWLDHELKTARFIVGDTLIETPFTGDTVPVPKLIDTKKVIVGAYTDDLATSDLAITCKRSILCYGGKQPEPDEDVYEKIMEMINEGLLNGGGNGTNGKDGITPQLRINETTNEWEVSYDNGTSWTSLGVKATGQDGAPGKDGVDGKDGEKGDRGEQGIQGEKGEKGEDGNDYVLTEDDKAEIAETVREGLSDILGDIETSLDSIIAIQESLIGGETV